MINITILCVGSLKESYFKSAIAEYQKRLSAYCRFQISEIPESALPDNPSDTQITAALEKEGALLKRQIPDRCFVIAMCIEGKQLSSPEFAALIREKSLYGDSHFCFIIGSSCGLADTVKARANLQLSVSKMTFPHQLFRVLLTEQIYRAFQIIGGGKYHK